MKPNHNVPPELIQHYYQKFHADYARNLERALSDLEKNPTSFSDKLSAFHAGHIAFAALVSHSIRGLMEETGTYTTATHNSFKQAILGAIGEAPNEKRNEETPNPEIRHPEEGPA